MQQMGNNTGIEVPADIVADLAAGKRPPVVVTVNGYEYRSTVAPMGGKCLLPFSAERRAQRIAAGRRKARGLTPYCGSLSLQKAYRARPPKLTDFWSDHFVLALIW